MPRRYVYTAWFSSCLPVLLLSCILLLVGGPIASQARVSTALKPDGTLGTTVGTTRGTTVTRNGTVHDINGGTKRGSNLFHSFERFSVGTHETASFHGPNGIANIVARVTGGHQSRLDGTLQSTIDGANLYLLNPHGVLFGPHATLQVTGSFHVSTADYLRFADGTKFFATLAPEGGLTVAPPAAFGFLGAPPAPITIRGSSLQVTDGKTISVVGGDVTIRGRGPVTKESVPTLGAASGQIQVASVASAGEVLVRPLALAPAPQVDGVMQLGQMRLVQGAILDVSEPEASTGLAGAGTVRIRGGRLQVDESQIVARTRNTDGASTGIDLQVAEDIVVTKGGKLIADALGVGKAGDIRIRAGSVAMDHEAEIRSEASETSTRKGQAGDIELRVGRLSLTDRSQISTTTFGLGQGGQVQVRATETLRLADLNSGIFARASGTEAKAGSAGSITVKAPRVVLTDGAQISSSTEGPGPAGRVRVRAMETLKLAGTISAILARTSGAGGGNAGRIKVQAPRVALTAGARLDVSTTGLGQGGQVQIIATETLTLSGGSPAGAFRSGIFARNEGTGEGNAGSIKIQAPRVALTDGAQISSSTGGLGQAGQVRVTATETLVLSGTSIHPTGGPQPGGIFATSTSGTGAAGSIKVQASRVVLTDRARISSSTGGPGQGGQVRVTATETLTLSGTNSAGTLPSGIFAITREESTGPAGDIEVQAPRVTLTEGAKISSSSSGTGAAGTVTVRAKDTVAIHGQGSGLFTDAGEHGKDGGDIVLQAANLQLTADSAISATSAGMGNAGNIAITVGDMFLSDQSAVATVAAHADGGDIQVTARRLARLRDSTITATVGGGRETVGGNITLVPEILLLERSKIIAKAFEGHGGNIHITAEGFLADPASKVKASSALGIDGRVDIQAQITNLSGLVAPLARDFAAAEALLRNRCAARLHEGTVSSLVARGRDDVPGPPDGILPSRLYAPSPEDASTAAQESRARATTGGPLEVHRPARALAPLMLELACAKY